MDTTNSQFDYKQSTVSSIVAECVDCFKCSSRNGSNPACEDPFHNLNTTKVTSPFIPDPAPLVIYHSPCYAGKKGREGLFPASACIKLTGVFGKLVERVCFGFGYISFSSVFFCFILFCFVTFGQIKQFENDSSASESKREPSFECLFSGGCSI